MYIISRKYEILQLIQIQTLHVHDVGKMIVCLSKLVCHVLNWKIIVMSSVRPTSSSVDG